MRSSLRILIISLPKIEGNSCQSDSKEMNSDQAAPLSPAIHFSRILTEQGRYMQRINLNRIIDALAKDSKLLSPPVALGMKGIDDAYEKSCILIQILQGRGEKEFKLFLKAVTAEPKGSKYYEATREFFAGFVLFKGYEEYAAWPNSESLYEGVKLMYLH